MTDLFGLIGLFFIYIIVGTVVTAILGGRDPLSFGPAWVIILWPVLLLFLATGGVVFAVEERLQNEEPEQ